MSETEKERPVADDQTPADDLATVESDADVLAETTDSDVTPESLETDETAFEPEDQADADPVQQAEPAAEPAAETPAPASGRVQGGSRAPLVLGVVVAAALGVGAAVYLNMGLTAQIAAMKSDFDQRLSAQADQAAQLQAALAQAQSQTDVADLKARIDSIPALVQNDVATAVAPLTARVAALETALGALEQRVLTVEKRPLAESVASEVVAAYEAEIAQLRDEIAQSRTEIQAMVENARTLKAETQQEALRSEGANLLAQINAALVEGRSFAQAVSALQAKGVTVPAGLSAVAGTGVATQTDLIDQFPDAARAALHAVRTELAEQGQNKVIVFLQNQLGMRSVAPKQGNSADAILSRAEAALRAKDLDTALSEIQTLPQVGQDAMAAWVALAQQRRTALSAFDALKNNELSK